MKPVYYTAIMIIILPPGFLGVVSCCFQVLKTMKFSHMLWYELKQQDFREFQIEGQLQNRPCNSSPSHPSSTSPPSLKSQQIVQYSRQAHLANAIHTDKWEALLKKVYMSSQQTTKTSNSCYCHITWHQPGISTTGIFLKAPLIQVKLMCSFLKNLHKHTNNLARI